MPDGERLIQPCVPGRSVPFAVGIDDLSRAPYMCVGVCVGVCACVIAVVSLSLSLSRPGRRSLPDGTFHCRTEGGNRLRARPRIPIEKVSRYPCAVFTLHTHTHTHTRAVLTLNPISPEHSSSCSSQYLTDPPAVPPHLYPAGASVSLSRARAPNGGA
jgi:hypothetical protein